jgi:hypothetical protein
MHLTQFSFSGKIEEYYGAQNECSSAIDDLARHKTKPPTVWFCSATSDGRILKIIGIPHREHKEFILKSAYEPEDWEIDLYEENQ